jgi:hypothetical protein
VPLLLTTFPFSVLLPMSYFSCACDFIFTCNCFYCHFNFCPKINGTVFPACPEALLELVRDELGTDAAEELVPMVKGGVQTKYLASCMIRATPPIAWRASWLSCERTRHGRTMEMTCGTI